jgi:hypothetical protein
MLRQRGKGYKEFIKTVTDNADDVDNVTVADLPTVYQGDMQANHYHALQESTNLLRRLMGFVDGLEAARGGASAY